MKNLIKSILFSKDRVLVDNDIIFNMFQVCQLKTCLAKGEIKSWHIRGGVLVIMWTCENGLLGLLDIIKAIM